MDVPEIQLAGASPRHVWRDYISQRQPVRPRLLLLLQSINAAWSLAELFWLDTLKPQPP